MAQVTLTLPDRLAEEASRAGLLQPQVIEALLRDAMREQRIERLFATMARLRHTEPRLSEEEVLAEIEAARVERRTRHADRR